MEVTRRAVLLAGLLRLVPSRAVHPLQVYAAAHCRDLQVHSWVMRTPASEARTAARQVAFTAMPTMMPTVVLTATPIPM